MSLTFVALALVTASPATRFVRSLFDDTFAGIHQLAWFDWALLIPYFAVLAVLSVYGIHRYEIIRTYFKHRKKATTGPAKHWDELPPVTIQLPLYNERYVVERLIEEVTKIEYPAGKLQIQVLDDSTDDTAPFAEPCASATATWASPSTTTIGITVTALRPAPCRRVSRPPSASSWPSSTPISSPARLPHPHHPLLHRPQGGVVQTRWSYLNRDYNFSRKWKPCFWMATSSWSTARVPARAFSSTSTAPPESCAPA